MDLAPERTQTIQPRGAFEDRFGFNTPMNVSKQVQTHTCRWLHKERRDDRTLIWDHLRFENDETSPHVDASTSVPSSKPPPMKGTAIQRKEEKGPAGTYSMAPPVPPRTKPLEKMIHISPCEGPSSSTTTTTTEAVYEDIDSLKTDPTETSQSLTVPVKPTPLPRSKSPLPAPKSPLPAPKSPLPAPKSPLPRSQSCPRPVRPPPSPPTKNKRQSSCSSAATTNGSHDGSSTTTGHTLETTDGGERPRSTSPRPPPRPPPPSNYLASSSEYKRGLTHQYVNTGEHGASPQRPQQPPPPPQFTVTPPPPRPHPLLPPPPAPARPATRPPVVSYSSGAYDVQQGVDYQPPPYLEVLADETDNRTVSYYSVIDCPPYLEVLPDENGNRIRLSNSTQYMGLTPGRTPPTPPPPTTLPRCPNGDVPLHQEEEVDSLLRWMKTMAYSNDMGPSLYGRNIEDETREFNQRALNVKKALRLYHLLLIQRNATLRSLITQLRGISNMVDKAQKKTKTMGIAGGATGAVGGVAAVVGIALAPVTMGTSLVATAVGAGMVASAGGMGAHAAIKRKKCVERRAVERIVQDYGACAGDVECCAALLRSGADELRRHDLCRLQRAGGAQPEALRMGQLAQTVYDAAVAHMGGCMSSERLIQSFEKEMDLYFTEKDGQRLKQSAECKFMGRVRLLAQDLEGALDALNEMWKRFSIV